MGTARYVSSALSFVGGREGNFLSSFFVASLPFSSVLFPASHILIAAKNPATNARVAVAMLFLLLVNFVLFLALLLRTVYLGTWDI